jgi:hypothetical protein
MEVAADLIIHVALIATFIIVFFFSYAAMIEKKIVSNQTSEIIKIFTEKISAFLSDEQNAKMRSLLKTTNPPDLSASDAQVAKSNSDIELKTTRIMIIYLGASLVLVSILYYYGSFSLQPLFIKNFFALGAIALVDFVFISFFARNYKPSDYSIVEKSFYKTVGEWANEP